MTDAPLSSRSRFDRAIHELRAPTHGDDLAVQRIMHAVRLSPARRPWRGASIAAAVVAVSVAAGVWFMRVVPEPPTVTAMDQSSFVQFVYVGPEARTVSLVGSFNDWDPRANPLKRDGTQGVWSAEVPLAPGHHEYAFNVDGRWVPDDDAPTGASDEFGVANSVILVQ